MLRTLTVLALLAVAACKGYSAEPFTAPKKLGGKTITAEQLNRGQVGYMQYCRTCHGEKGDGNGPSAVGLRPPPRNFTRGVFKFAAVAAPGLPHDDDFVRIVKGGLHGTAMLPWDVPDMVLEDIIQYLKTFTACDPKKPADQCNDRWKDEEPAEKIVATPDPWTAKKPEAIAMGKKLYHGYAQCASCHPAYASKQEIYEASKELNPDNPISTFRDDLYLSSPTDSTDFSLEPDSSKPLRILPPDFTRSDLRSIRKGHDMEDLWRVIASGVGGTAMPSWKASGLEDQKIWALAYYVQSLVELKGTPGVAELEKKNAAANASYVAPPPAPAPEEAPKTDGKK